MGEGDDVLDRIDRAERVGDVRNRHDLRLRAEQLLQLVEPQLALVGHGNDAQVSLLLLAQDLPRNNVRMMLERRDDDLVAGVYMRAAKGLRDEIDGFGCATGEDNLAQATGVDELLRLETRLLVRLGGA